MHGFSSKPNSAILVDMANATGVVLRRQLGLESFRGQLDLEQRVAVVNEGLEVNQLLVVRKHTVDSLERLRNKNTGDDF